jgi:hypothetical protein
MDGNALRASVKDVVATLMGSWRMLEPSLLQTFHKLALASSPATKDIPVPEDAPIHDLPLGHVMRPSEMQAHLLTRVIPPMLVAIQALAEDSLNNHYGNERKIKARIEDMVVVGHLTRTLASRAHYWRIVRNVHAHAGGRLDQRTLDEISTLILEGKALEVLPVIGLALPVGLADLLASADVWADAIDVAA